MLQWKGEIRRVHIQSACLSGIYLPHAYFVFAGLGQGGRRHEKPGGGLQLDISLMRWPVCIFDMAGGLITQNAASDEIIVSS